MKKPGAMHKDWLVGAILAAISAGIILDGGFVYDDHVAITGNPCVTSLVSIPAVFTRDLWCTPLGDGVKVYRPGIVLAWKALWHVFPGSPLHFRLVTLVFHVLATVALVLLVRRLTGKPRWSAASGALFGAHAVHAEALGGITWQADVISGALGLLAFLAATGRPRFRNGAVAAALLLAACLVKESAFVFGAAILAWTILDRSRARMSKIGVPVAVVTVAFVVFQLSLDRVTSPSFTNNLAIAAHGWDRLLLGLYTIGKATALCFVPLGLAPNHGYAAVDLDPATLLPVAVPGAIAIAALSFFLARSVRRRDGATAALLVVFLGPVLLMSNLFLDVLTDLAERLLYAPSMAASVAMAVLLARLFGKPPARGVAVGLGAAAMMALTAGALRPWADDSTLWARAVEVEPKAFRSQLNYSEILLADGRVDEGSWHRLLARHILSGFPGRVDWAPVERLEAEPLPGRMLSAPAVLSPDDPCSLLRDFLSDMESRLPGYTGVTGPYFKRRYGDCGIEALRRTRTAAAQVSK